MCATHATSAYMPSLAPQYEYQREASPWRAGSIMLFAAAERGKRTAALRLPWPCHDCLHSSTCMCPATYARRPLASHRSAHVCGRGQCSWSGTRLLRSRAMPVPTTPLIRYAQEGAQIRECTPPARASPADRAPRRPSRPFVRLLVPSSGRMRNCRTHSRAHAPVTLPLPHAG